MAERLLWSEDLTDAQVKMLIDCGEDTAVELRGGAWATARALARKGLGTIDGEGGPLQPMFWPNADGLRIAHEFDDLAEDEEWEL